MFKLQSVLLTFTWRLSYNADFVFVISLFALTLFLYLQHRLYWIWIQRLFYPITLFTFLEAISALWGKDCGTSKTKLVLCPQTTIILFAKECLRGCSMIYGFWWVPMALFETVGKQCQIHENHKHVSSLPFFFPVAVVHASSLTHFSLLEFLLLPQKCCNGRYISVSLKMTQKESGRKKHIILRRVSAVEKKWLVIVQTDPLHWGA